MTVVTTTPARAPTDSVSDAPAPSTATRVRLGGARLWAAQRFPYFATGLFALTLLERPDLGTLSGDAKWRLYADPEVVAGLTTAQLGTALVHHLGHLLRDHARRGLESGAAEVSPNGWNLASDCEIDDDLVADGGRFAEPPRLPSDFGWEDGQLAETYLTLWQQPAHPDNSSDAGALGTSSGTTADIGGKGLTGQRTAGAAQEQASSGSSEEPEPDPNPSSGSGPDANTVSEHDTDTSAGSDKQDSSPDRPSGRADSGDSSTSDPSTTPAARWTIDCGSAAHGQSRPWEVTDDSTPGLDSADADLVRRRTATAVLAHAKEGGTVPAGLLRWAHAAPSVIDWRRVLAAEIRRALKRTAGSSDFTFARRSRRATSLPGVILPGLFRPTPEVAVVLDTSGSMGPSDLAEALGEVDGILERAGLTSRRVPVLACDTEVGAVTLAGRASDVELAGGGGTDLRVGLEAAGQLRPRPDVVVVLTDGYTPWPKASPRGISVVVGLIGEEVNWCSREVPSWARAVTIERAS